MPEIAVDADVLRYHAGGVEKVAADVHEAASAAAGLDLDGGAFGLMCSFMVLPATIASAAGVAVIGSAGRLLDRTAVQVRAWADDAQAVEDQAGATISTLIGQVEAR